MWAPHVFGRFLQALLHLKLMLMCTSSTGYVSGSGEPETRDVSGGGDSGSEPKTPQPSPGMHSTTTSLTSRAQKSQKYVLPYYKNLLIMHLNIRGPSSLRSYPPTNILLIYLTVPMMNSMVTSSYLIGLIF